MVKPVRRVVTGHDVNGKAIVIKDGVAENVVVSVGEGGDMHLPAFDWDLWSVPLCVALAQVVSVIWSDQLGLNVDNPFAGQDTLSRVVADVPLYAVGK